MYVMFHYSQLQASKSKSAEDSISKSPNGSPLQQNPSHPPADYSMLSIGSLRKSFSSTPDLKNSSQIVPLIPLEELKTTMIRVTNPAENSQKAPSFVAKTDLDLRLPHHMLTDNGNVGDQRNYFTLPGRRNKKFPPPDHAPPPPPPPPPVTSEMMVVKSPDKSASSPNKTASPTMSSFKPDDNLPSPPPPPVHQGGPESLPPNSEWVKNRSPPARANSMPPRASRPQVLKKMDSKETYNINGVNYTTYTTFMSPLTPDDIPDVNFAGKPPMIPEPDYEEPNLNNGMGSRTLERKKKKSVSFLEDISKKEESNVRKINHSTNKKPESILKTNEVPPSHCQHGKPILRGSPNPNNHTGNSPALASDKYIQPIEKIPRLKTEPPLAKTNAIIVPNVAKTVVKVLPEDKIRIEISTTAAKNLQKSQSFSHKSAKMTTLEQSGPTSLQLGKPVTGKLATSTENTNTTSISANDILNARSSLKPSRSFPNELNDNDNSSSGVSSDQDSSKNLNSNSNGTTTKFVTYLPVESSTPITKKTYDSESSESSFESNTKESQAKISTMKKMLHPKLAAIFDLPPNQSYASQTLPNKSKLKKLTSSVSNPMSKSSERSISESLALINQHVNSLGEVNHLVTSETPVGVLAPPPGFSDPESFSDNESLSSNGSKGFQQQQQQLHHVNKSHGHHNKVNFHVSSSGKKAGNSKKSAANSDASHWNMTRSMEGFLDQSVQGLINANDVMSRSMDYSGFYGTMSKKQLQQQSQSGGGKGFRSKPLMGWTIGDVCDWLDSLFLPEYKPAFIQAEVDGLKLAGLTKSELEGLGVIRVGHMLNIERSLKRYLEVTF